MPSNFRRLSIALLAVPACALALAACSSSPSPSASSTTSTSAATTSTASRSVTTGSSSQTSGTLAPQTATSTEFFSPTKNISCEIDNNFGPSATTQALCLTFTSPKSVTLTSDGSLTECTGQTCLSNAGDNTPTLAYGQTITLGPFTCASSTAGMKCTIAGGKGFLISAALTTPLGNATVVPSTTTTSTSG